MSTNSPSATEASAKSVQTGATSVLIGANNHGKSNILKALNFFFNASVKPSMDDFFVHRDADVLWVEVVFEGLSEQELRTFGKYVDDRQRMTVRKTAGWCRGARAAPP